MVVQRMVYGRVRVLYTCGLVVVVDGLHVHGCFEYLNIGYACHAASLACGG